MLYEVITQLKEAGKSDKYYDVLEEVPRVRKDFGYPPLVTPTSQIVGTQAVLNVISGERYKVFTKESKAVFVITSYSIHYTKLYDVHRLAHLA